MWHTLDSNVKTLKSAVCGAILLNTIVVGIVISRVMEAFVCA
jgi:hypothetical protein